MVGSWVSVAAWLMLTGKVCGVCACVRCAETVLAMLVFALVPTLVLALLAIDCWDVAEGSPWVVGAT